MNGIPRADYSVFLRNLTATGHYNLDRSAVKHLYFLLYNLSISTFLTHFTMNHTNYNHKPDLDQASMIHSISN